MAGKKRQLLDREKELVEKYWKLVEEGTESIRSIAIKEGVTFKVIDRIFKMCGYKAKNSRGGEKYILNKDYFKVIDSEQKAYWLGYLWADGCTNKYSIIMELQIRDKYHLELFLKEIYGEKHPELKEKDGCVIANISSMDMVNDLKALGYGIKDKRTSIPTMSNELYRHFIRGYYDGDGDFNIKDKYFRIAGRGIFLDNLSKLFPLGMSNFRFEVHKNNKSARLFFRSNTRNFIANFLYLDSTIFLTRKRDNVAPYISDNVMKTS